MSIATLEGEEPSVLEVELMPSTGALLSPDWVPWSDRLADYEAAQDALAAVEIAPGALSDDDDVDHDDDDDDDEDDDDVLHAGDVDGVDIDVLDDADDDDDDDDADADADADDDDDDNADDDASTDDGIERSY